MFELLSGSDLIDVNGNYGWFIDVGTILLEILKHLHVHTQVHKCLHKINKILFRKFLSG